ncbi:MAG: DUF1569 domain-containing protein [Ferruginibacter sp.]
MQSLYDVSTYNLIKERINKLAPQSEAQWGKMDVAQMLTHCQRIFGVPLSEKKLPRMLMGLLIGWAFKSKLYNEVPWKKNLPTAPSFRITDSREFENEKQILLELVEKFYTAGPTGISKYPHPLFGSLTPEQWGQSMYKHIDHHLQQFGV